MGDVQAFVATVLKVGADEAPSHVVPQVADKRGQRKKARPRRGRTLLTPRTPGRFLAQTDADAGGHGLCR